MPGSDHFCFSFWWIIPIIMMVLCACMCFFRKGRTRLTMCGESSLNKGSHKMGASDSAMELLNKRYALGELDKEEYEEKRTTLIDSD